MLKALYVVGMGVGAALLIVRRVVSRGGRERRHLPGKLREVIPYGLMFSRMNYLVAAERGSSEPHNWRLDRIVDVAVLEEPGAPPESFSLHDYAARSFGIYQDEIQDVVLRISREGADDALTWRFHPHQLVEPQADGTVIVRFSVSGMLGSGPINRIPGQAEQ